MNRWADRLQRVTVPFGEPKPVTIVLPFYQNQQFFDTVQIATWRTRAYDELRPFVSVIVVDDGSPVPAQLPILDHPFPLRLFRIHEDRRWNWLAARNIGAHHAAAGWLALTDMDHVVPAETLKAIIYGQHDPGTVYAFNRREHTGEAIAPHSASFLLTRALFWSIGGYDETLSGFYGSDGDFRRRVARRAPIALLPDALVRYEFVADSSTTTYKRKQPEDQRVQQLIAQRGAGWRPKVLSFPYGEVTCSA